jgi:ABC-type transport system involved in cytochrome c biogenesis permease subunit
MNTLAKLILALAVSLCGARISAAQHSADDGHGHGHPEHTMPTRSAPYSERVLELAAALPVQDGGRVKPLSTFADFTLLRFNGKRSLKLDDGTKLDATTWLLDVLFYPQQAEAYRCFQVNDVHAIEALGISTAGKKKRDRYSFHELEPGISKLFELARQYRAKEERLRSSVEQQIFTLASNVDDYFALKSHFDFARAAFDVGQSPELVATLGGETASFSTILAKLPRLIELQSAWRVDPARAEDSRELVRLVQSAADYSSVTSSLALMPALVTEPANANWHTPSDVLSSTFETEEPMREHLETLAAFETLAMSIGDPARFESALAALHGRTVATAIQRGEYAKVPLEISYYKAQLLTYSLAIFLLGFVLTGLLWIAPRLKLLYAASSLAVVVSTGLLVTAIVMRCMIRGRPPVSTLYETLLFVAAVTTLVLLVVEWINRQRLALSVAAAFGTIMLFLANGYETLDKRDTMPQLVAVLDTNFWLATHVTAITSGYAAGLGATAIASVYLVCRLFGATRRKPELARLLTRMTYGVLCFALIFSVVGTILGGVWANDSWGRFWGWDPKENGALLICLAQLVILHGRMGGYLREFGLAAATAFQGTIIAFSWFHVNLLGVGLHSYGFTSGIHTSLWTYYTGQWGLIAFACGHYWLERERSKAVAQALTEQRVTSVSSDVGAT